MGSFEAVVEIVEIVVVVVGVRVVRVVRVVGKVVVVGGRVAAIAEVAVTAVSVVRMEIRVVVGINTLLLFTTGWVGALECAAGCKAAGGGSGSVERIVDHTAEDKRLLAVSSDHAGSDCYQDQGGGG
jgi:hypothetical protein